MFNNSYEGDTLDIGALNYIMWLSDQGWSLWLMLIQLLECLKAE